MQTPLRLDRSGSTRGAIDLRVARGLKAALRAFRRDGRASFGGCVAVAGHGLGAAIVASPCIM